MNRTTRDLAITALTLLAAAPLSLAGPLTPPPGPISSTHKTLTEVEPRIPINAANTPGDADSLYKITQPGSYYLTGNITGVAAKHGIEIASTNVTLDLGGFTLLGVPGSLNGISDINSGSAARGLRLMNGKIEAWGEQGVKVNSALDSVAENLFIYDNGSWGLTIGDGSHIRYCNALGNGAGGFAVGNASTVEHCAARGNATHGFVGNGTFTACTAIYNTEAGFLTGHSNLTNCTSSSNKIGFNIDSASSITDCSAFYNTEAGIKASSFSRIVGNNCSNNGYYSGQTAAGILITGARNAVESNTCASNDQGIKVDAAGNFIARNTCSSNTTNYSITGTQTIGPIITATGTITTTNPWANFSF